MFQRTTAINKILALDSKIKVVQGGTYAGKTHGIIPIIHDKLSKKGSLKSTVVAETIPAVKDGALDIFKEVMQDTNRWVDDRFIKNPMEYTYGNKSRIQFKSFDTPGKAKASGKRDILFLNEANHIPFPIAYELILRSEEVYIDYNPNNEFWVHDEILTESNSELLILNYKDNEACPQRALEEIFIRKSRAFHDPDGDIHDEANIKDMYWANWYMVYGLGEIGNLEGAVFPNWELIEDMPEDIEWLCKGMDLGYTNDPTTIIDVARKGDNLYFNERCYKHNMNTQHIKDRLEAIETGRNDEIISDINPRLINELGSDYNVRAAEKGPGSIMNGVELLQRFNLHITKSSINLIKEFRNYLWKVDKTGKKINEPIDAYNHGIDGLRYAAMYKINPTSASWMDSMK